MSLAAPERGSRRHVLFTWLGRALALAGLVLLLVQLHEYGGRVRWDSLGVAAIFGLAVLAGLYGGAGIMLALAWRHLLRHLGVEVPAGWAVRVYGSSQIAKYLPGNIFHLLGRQALAGAAGYPAGPVARATLWELATLATVAALFMLLALPVPAWLPARAGGPVLFLACFAAVFWLVRRRLGPDLAAAVLWYGAFHVVSAGVFAVCLLQLTASPSVVMGQLGLVVGVYVVAWLAGLLVPGAPAGLGVRELVLLTLLGQAVEPAGLVAATVAARLVTVSGDLAFFIGAAWHGPGRS